MVMEGKRIVFLTACVLNFVGFICLLIAFASPYWVVSWPRVYSGFKRTGLWETCLAGLVLQRDPTQKAYHGCWWILSPEYKRIREWLMPWWFIITQIVITFALVAEGIDLIIMLMVYMKTSKGSNTGVGKVRAPYALVKTTTVITIVSAVFKTCTLVLFGIAVYKDRMWMPRPDLNYMSWSYGLALMSTFFSIFSSIAHGVFHSITKREFYDLPSMSYPTSHMSSHGGSMAQPSMGSMAYPSMGSSMGSYSYPHSGKEATF